MLFSSVVFQFYCASDSFAKSDRTAMDCCVKNVSFLCLSGGIFHGSSPHFGFILSRSQDPKYHRSLTLGKFWLKGLAVLLYIYYI